ncbi:MAG: Polyribonucleotide nucleotidyltransferase [Alphaproteobacteria bacterium MarineAlpha6_Bin5]|nr:MAG: Polyribonucleotide nucleotidyltransferase [Alphaproteobacteria bacterium MarineAlpha6_Bin5]
MFNINKKEIEWGGKKLILETGRIARQADGAVLATYGDTTVLCTVVASKEPKEGVDFLPLTVSYQEKTFAAGKIPGGFFKREAKPSEKETLISRLIDRPIRPLFPENYYNETQIICTLLNLDKDTSPDIVAFIGASAALALSGAPVQSTVAAAKVGFIDKKFVLNPSNSELENSDLDLIVAGTKEGVLMVESEVKQLTEKTMLDAVMFAHKEFQNVIKFIETFAKAEKVSEIEYKNENIDKLLKTLFINIEKKYKNEFAKAYKEKDKSKRSDLLSTIRNKILEEFTSEDNDEITENLVSSAIKKLEKELVRSDILKTGKRIDGRDTKTVRPIKAEVGLLTRVHGSSLFTRGETQALVVTTLGTSLDEQIIDDLEGEYKEKFMLHYNFPPYSVGEASMLRPPGRREVGHGKLAWRAIKPLMPDKDKFPYTIRVVSEITESNGSSSMATVCGTSLSLMDAGVPLEKPIAGIAMGLIKEEKNYAVLSDILGDEDHLGDMDFKVAGTKDGITALQMDIKITSITKEIMEKALAQALEGRIKILSEMDKAISNSRKELNSNAPQIQTIKIDPSKIKDVIGSGGKTIKSITEETGAKIDIDDDGTIKVASTDSESGKLALEKIENITAEPELNQIYTGTVVKTMDFGAFVNFMGTKDGLVHISELADRRVGRTTDVVKVGDKVTVKVIGFDNRGKIKLSMKQLKQKNEKNFNRA